VFRVKMGATVDFATKIGNATGLAVSAVVKQFLIDSSFYQTHHKDKKQQMYSRMVKGNRDITNAEMFRRSAGGVVVATPSSSPTSLSSGMLLVPEIVAAVAELTPPPSPLLASKMERKVYTSENFPLDLDFFSHPLLGDVQVGMSMCPGRNKPKPKHVWKRDLNTDLKVIKDAGVEVLVVLVRSIELLSMGIMELFVRAEQLGMKTLHFPVQDKWVPESMSEVVQLVEKLIEFVRQGKKMSIFCNGGKGRTGMVVVATMVALGLTVDDAIFEIRRRRSGMIRNPAQIIYLRWFGKSFVFFLFA
jgi:protein-tyrosine phosphatase